MFKSCLPRQTQCLTGSSHLLPSPPIKKSSLTEYHQNYQKPLSRIPIKWILDPTRLHSGWTERKTWRSINQTESTWLGRKALFPQVKPTKLNGMKGKVAEMLSSSSKPVGATPPVTTTTETKSVSPSQEGKALKCNYRCELTEKFQ